MNTTSALLASGSSYQTICTLVSDALTAAGVPYVHCSGGSLRRGESAADFWVGIRLSLDPKSDWPHNIFQNSRHANLSITVEGDKFVVECFSGGSKCDFAKKPFRKFRAVTLDDAAKRIADWCLANR